ncbi:MON2-like protein (macronuclear) [Tetrahymena thermophila SB210]|uniref:MON2-like protein n=1 Tax=Tetrahymena thermophila (strain SB210) TaxID=312017 RepID=Q22N01_TETTS|nr:MON2-like protein [Tetrahymena thermophila SB210]EAR86668.2 MON2-like protein [Tetrahymena thermophila SB210]|eukprot:XP_976869.2 MON2-like protein [Tetrahymena thermophila SB210]
MNSRHLEVLLEELKQFQNDTKKKYSEIKDEASKLYSQLEKLKKTFRDSGEKSEVRFPFELFEPLIKVVSNTKKSRVNINLMTILSRLFNLKLLHKYEEFYYILDYLHKVVEIKKQNLIIKLQQTLFNLITPQIISILKLDYIQLALTIMLKIREQFDIAMIKSLNFTIQSQIISVISQQAVKYEQAQVQNNYMKIFKDFISIIDKNIPQWFGNTKPTPEIGIECLSIMIDEGEKVFKGNCELENILQNDLINKLDQILQSAQGQKDENLYIKVLKLQTKIVGLIHSKYAIFQKYNLNDQKKFSKLRFSALESYNNIFTKLESFQKFIESTYRPNTTNCQFIDFLKDLTEVVKDLFGNLTVNKKRRQKSYADSVGADIDGVVELNGNDFLLLCIQIINNIAQNITQMCSNLSNINLMSLKKYDKSYKFSYDEENFRQFFEDVYRHLYNILKLIFSALNHQNIPLDQQNAQLFITSRNCIFLSLFLNKQKAFAQFIKLVCQTILTKDSHIDKKFLYNTQIFFYIYENFPECLNVTCWEYLIYYLHLCNYLIVKEEERKDCKSLTQFTARTQGNNTAQTHQTYQTQYTETQTKQNQTEIDEQENQITQFVEKIKQFFKNTQHLTSKQLNSLIVALENSTYDMLEDTEFVQQSGLLPRHQKSESISTPLLFSPTSQQVVNISLVRRQFDETFTLTKIYEVVLSNKHRVHLIWKNVSSTLITISTCRDMEFRIKAVTILGSILLEIGQYFATGNQINQTKENTSQDSIKICDSPLMKSSQDLEAQFSPSEVQGIIFSAWESLSMCQFQEVKSIISDQMEQVINTLGSTLNIKGRQALLKVLMSFSEVQKNDKYIENFQCIILLIQATSVTDTNINEIEQYMKTLQGFINNSGDEQVIYHSCQQFLKLIQYLNELAKNQKSTYIMNTILNYVRDILFCLVQISTHSNVEIREQSLDCFATAIVEYSENFDMTFWTQIIFKDILFKISSDTIKYLYQYLQEQLKLKQENQEFQEWQSSSMQLIDSITEITQKFIEFVQKKKQTENLQPIQESLHETLSESQICGDDGDNSIIQRKNITKNTINNNQESNQSSEEDGDASSEKTSKTLLEFAPKTNRTDGHQPQALSSKLITLMNQNLINNTISDKKVLNFEKKVKSATNLENSKEKEDEDHDHNYPIQYTENFETEGDQVIKLVSFEDDIEENANQDDKNNQENKEGEDEKINSQELSGQKQKKHQLKIKDSLAQQNILNKKKLVFPKSKKFYSKTKTRQISSLRSLDSKEQQINVGKETVQNGYELQQIDEMKESIEKQQQRTRTVTKDLIQMNKIKEVESSRSIENSQEAKQQVKQEQENAVEDHISDVIRQKQETQEWSVNINEQQVQKQLSNSSSYKNIVDNNSQSAASTKIESDTISEPRKNSDAEVFRQQPPLINFIKADEYNNDDKLKELQSEESEQEATPMMPREQKAVEINSLELYFIILGDFISFKVTDITFLCVKDIAQFIKNYPQYTVYLQQEIITVIDRLDDFFSQIPIDIVESKKIIENGIPETVGLLRQILSIDRIPRKKDHEQMIATSMALLYKIMIFPNMVEQTFNNVLYQVQYSDDQVYDLLNDIVMNFKNKRTLYKSIFICFIKEFFQEDMSDPFFDKTLKKILQIIKSLISNETKINKKYIYDVLLHIYRIINLKYDNAYHHFWYTSLNQQSNPIWYEATQIFTFIANILVSNKIQTDPILQLTLDFFKQEIKEQDKVQFKSEEDLMLYLDHDKTLLLFLLKSFALGEVNLTLDQALDIGQLIHTFSQRKPNIQLEKIHLLEKFQTQSFSQFCLEALFQISNYMDGCSSQRLFNSQIFLPFFLSRAQAIFDKFISTLEQQNQKATNQVKEVQSRQFLHFLENLQNLNIAPNTFKEFKSNKIYSSLPYRLKKIENPLLNNSKGHIGYLMPQLTECIHSNNSEVRDLVKIIIQTYHQKIGVYELQ